MRLPRDITYYICSIRLGFVCRDKMMMCCYWLGLVMMQSMPSCIVHGPLCPSLCHLEHAYSHNNIKSNFFAMCSYSLYSSYHQALPPVTKIGNNGSWGDFLLELCQGTFIGHVILSTKCIL